MKILMFLIGLFLSSIVISAPISTTGTPAMLDLSIAYGAMYNSTLGKIKSKDNNWLPSQNNSQSRAKWLLEAPQAGPVNIAKLHASMMSAEYMKKSSESNSTAWTLFSMVADKKTWPDLNVAKDLLDKDISIVFSVFTLGDPSIDDATGSLAMGRRGTLELAFDNDIFPIQAYGNPARFTKAFAQSVLGTTNCPPGSLELPYDVTRCYAKDFSERSAWRHDSEKILIVQQARKPPGSSSFWFGDEPTSLSNYTMGNLDPITQAPVIDVSVDITDDLILNNYTVGSAPYESLKHPSGTSTATAFMTAYAQDLILYANAKSCKLTVSQLMDTVTLSTKEYNNRSIKDARSGWGIYNHAAAKSFIDNHYCAPAQYIAQHSLGKGIGAPGSPIYDRNVAWCGASGGSVVKNTPYPNFDQCSVNFGYYTVYNPESQSCSSPIGGIAPVENPSGGCP